MKEQLEDKIYYQYADDVINGKIVACKWVKLACKRFMNDLQRDDLKFDIDKADYAINFIQMFKHFTGKHNGKQFILSPWQAFITASITGFYWRVSGLRRYNNCFVMVARKAGKSFWASALMLYFFIADKEASASCDFVANSLEQSRLCFSMCQQFCRQLDPKGKYLRTYRNKIYMDANNSTMSVLASDASKLDGRNSSAFVWDEGHAAKDDSVYSVMKSSQGDRQNPMAITISTAGFNLTGPFYKMYQTNCEILQGVKDDDSTFAIIYQLDEGDDWTDPNNYIKANPNLGITVTKEFLDREVNAAKLNTVLEVGVKTKNLNLFCQSSEVWISDNYINEVTENINLSDFSEDDFCFVGIDLAAVSDITAVSYLIAKEDDTLYFKTDYYLPETMLTESPNRELYKHWHRTGQLKITQGNVTDYDYIVNDLMQNYEKLSIRKIGYDSWNSTQFAINATELGLPLEPYSQSIGNFNKPTRELERLIRSKKVVIDNNEITRWMFRNVALKSDHNGNVKPNKGAGKDKKIDGIIAMIEALGTYLDTPRYKGEIFTI